MIAPLFHSMKIAFTKLEGSGNDFVLIDNIKSNVPSFSKKSRSKLCDRKRGIGADGILLLEKDRKFPFMMRYFNADGKEAEMCGNGARCSALYASMKNIVPSKFSFRSKSGIHKAQVFENNLVKVELPACKFERNVKIKIEGKKFDGFFLTVGVPHLVIFAENIDKVDVEKIGKRIRNLKRFTPEGTNVNFVKIKNRNRLSIRTYERGVEAETLSCGTGAAASAYIAYKEKNFPLTIYVKPQSKVSIKVSLEELSGEVIPHISAKAHIVFSGTVIVSKT